jgi:hypothetical protein
MRLKMLAAVSRHELLLNCMRGTGACGTCIAEMRLPKSFLNIHWSEFLWAIGGLYTRG